MATVDPGFGALVISLDFELYWGVREIVAANGDYQKNLHGEYDAIPKILELFSEFDIAATWATVGLLFADTQELLDEFRPSVLPQYGNPELSPFSESVMHDRDVRSVKNAADLIEAIRHTPRQRIGTHTYSHYYCLEDGQTEEAFAADIKSAIAIAARKGLRTESIVFPRNQRNPSYDKVLVENGIVSYRGNQNSKFYDFNGRTQSDKYYRGMRLLDSYTNVSGLNTYKWSDMPDGKLVNVKASMFLRPVGNRMGILRDLQFKRIAAGLERAAREGEVFHLWWHPHNFGTNLEENLGFLSRILEHFDKLRSGHGMRSLSMEGAAEVAVRQPGE